MANMAGEQDNICQGYDYEFVSDVPDEYICKICHLPIRNPVQTKCCGNRFCEDCLQEEIKRKRRPECPMDRQTLDIHQDVFPDKGAERTVNSFHIKCPCQGCKWQGQLGNVESHLQKCDYQVIKCGNEQCDVMKPRMEMTNHRTNECRWREVQCPHCGTSCTFFQLQDHWEVCPPFPVKCPNDCGKQTTNEKIADHVDNECPLTKIPCTYHRFGCQLMVRRNDMDDHMEKGMKDHLALTFERLTLVSDRLQILQDKNDTLSSNLSFYFLFIIIIILYNLSSLRDENKMTLAAVQQQAIRCTNKFVWKITNIKEKLEKAKSSSVTYLYSDPFYTEKYGYKLRVKLYPNGDTAECAGHISIYYYILRGEYDALLPWPFPKDVTFTVVDQKEILTNRKNVKMTVTHKDVLIYGPKHIQRPTSDLNEGGWGFGKFLSHETLMSENYIVDNSIFILVDVTDPPASYIHGILA